MFFLLTHILIGKYYPNLITQFIIGCICYIVAYFLIRDTVSEEMYEQYKYYGFALVGIDTAFLIYKGKNKTEIQKESQNYDNQNYIQSYSPTNTKNEIEQFSANLRKTEKSNNSQSNDSEHIHISKLNKIEQPRLDSDRIYTGGIPSITLSSEINDYRVTHEPSNSIGDDTIFLASDEEKNNFTLDSISLERSAERIKPE